jgi:hypothetical protein
MKRARGYVLLLLLLCTAILVAERYLILRGPVGDKSGPREVTRTHIKFILNEMYLYYATNHSMLPNPGGQPILRAFIERTDPAVAGKYFESQILDGWGAPMHLQMSESQQGIRLSCASWGPNGRDDGGLADDVTGVLDQNGVTYSGDN